MMIDKPAAFQATIHNFRTVPSRKVLQIVIETPIEQQAEVARICEHGAWVAVARIQEASVESSGLSSLSPDSSVVTGRPAPVEESRAKPFRDLSPQQQAGIIANEPPFWRFIEDNHESRCEDADDAANFIRTFCEVQSRKDLATDHRARVLWNSLVNQYRLWRDHPELAS